MRNKIDFLGSAFEVDYNYTHVLHVLTSLQIALKARPSIFYDPSDPVRYNDHDREFQGPKYYSFL
jgi:hypothetical protein